MHRFTDFQGVPNSNAPHQKIAFSDAAQTLPAILGAPLDAKTKFVVISIETNDVRFTPEGKTTPTNSTAGTPSVGVLGSAGDHPILLSRAEADVALWINAVNAANAVGQVTQYLD